MSDKILDRSIISSCLAGILVFGGTVFSRAEGAPATTPVAATTNQPPQPPTIADVAAIDHDRILRRAAVELAMEPVTITKHRSKLSPGGPNDYYSTSDFWWPDPNSSTGLPYVKRNQVNPKNFADHRKCLLQLRDHVTALAAAYKITGNDHYAEVAVKWLRTFFLDPNTRMNPNLQYAQAVPGVSQGRSSGISDSLPLIEVPKAIEALEPSPALTPQVSDGLKKWFTDYLQWMNTSTNGDDAAETSDDVGVGFWLQASVFADYVGDQDQLTSCRNRFKYFFLPNQMAPDGSFPHQMTRSMSYAFSLCLLDNLTAMCQVLSTTNDDLWHFTALDKGTIRNAVDFLYPYIEDESTWPKNPDAQGSWPIRQSSLLFAGLAYNDPKYITLWKTLNSDPASEAVRRNTAILQPVLWVK